MYRPAHSQNNRKFGDVGMPAIVLARAIGLMYRRKTQR